MPAARPFFLFTFPVSVVFWRMHLLQVCNVGNIVGGTAACAWTVTRCFPDCRHTVAFLSDISAETCDAFSHCRILRWKHVTRELVADVIPDVIILHNTPASRCDARLPVPSVQYLHSRIRPAAADVTIACSHWLAKQLRLPVESVVHQAVPRPVRQTFQSDRDVVWRWMTQSKPSQAGKPDVLRIGRLCTPQRKKWPNVLIPFYASLAAKFPSVRWDFVGCPADRQPDVLAACRSRAAFFPASWLARRRLWHWDALVYHNPRVTESFGRTVAEAMRAGCIPIVDARGGFVEQIAEGCGFLCDNPRDFTAAICAIQSREDRYGTSRRCREHADGVFSLREFRKRLVGVFERITLSRRNRDWQCRPDGRR